MKVVGTIAFFGGTVKRTNDPSLVDAVYFSVQDNGEPGEGVDKISRVAFFDDDPNTTGDPAPQPIAARVVAATAEARYAADLRSEEGVNMRFRFGLSAALAAAFAGALLTAAGGFAFSSSGPVINMLVDPPTKPNPDMIDIDNFYDTDPAGLCVKWSNVYTPAAERASGTAVGMYLGYAGQWRESRIYAVSAALRVGNMHIVIWLYRWNGASWQYTGRSLVRYPTATPPFWRGISGGDDNASNVPKFHVADNSGYYRIRVGLVTPAGAVADTAYVKAFRNNASADGSTYYCAS